jgi:O-antigen/teichoic acid export membrane protein
VRLFDLLVVHVVSFFIGFLVGVWLLPASSRRLASIADGATWCALLDYGKWIVAGSLMSTLNSGSACWRSGTYLTPRFVGEYAAAHTLIGAVEIVIVSLNTVFLPLACRVRGRPDARRTRTDAQSPRCCPW